jgi:hypothetical protein
MGLGIFQIPEQKEKRQMDPEKLWHVLKPKQEGKDHG